MPRTTTKSSPDLKISLAAPPNWTFAPGDTVIGTVVRHLPIVSPSATVSIWMMGRVKTKIQERNSSSGNTYRGGRFLVRTKQTIIYRGPVHLAGNEPRNGENSSLSWAFSLDIPTRTMDGKSKPLPGTCWVERDVGAFEGSAEGFVEYYLEARMVHARSGHHECHMAITPITLRHSQSQALSLPPRYQAEPQDVGSTSTFPGFQVRKYITERKVQTHLLIPGQQESELTFRQKAQRVFHSSHVPSFHFLLEISSPKYIQLDHPDIIPLSIRVSPCSRTSPGIKHIEQKIYIQKIKLTLKSRGMIYAEGHFTQSHDTSYSSKIELGVERLFAGLDRPIVLSCGGEGEEGKGGTLNLGNMFQLTLEEQGIRAGKRKLGLGFARRIAPDFDIGDFSLSNHLVWEVLMSVAGERVIVKRDTGVKILAGD